MKRKPHEPGRTQVTSVCQDWCRKLRLASIVALTPHLAVAQTLDIRDAVRTYSTLTNTTVTMSGRAELRVTGTGNPIPGCLIELDSTDACMLMTSILPSEVSSTFLSRVRVNGATAVLDSNCRVVQYGQGALVMPQGSGFAPLEVFAGRFFTGRSRRLNSSVAYNNASLGSMVSAMGSFKLKRGYAVTFAQEESGTGISRNYVAQDGDLEVGLLPSSLENHVHFIRVFPWKWTSKKGIAGDIESGLNVGWGYDWSIARNSTLDWEYVPIRQARYWPDLNQDWKARGTTHLLGYNEPDRPDQANLTVSDALSSWPDLLATGLRVGAPAVSDGGLSWLYDFVSQADTAGLRVDFVPVHYYRCYGDAGDPSGTATQFYNFLKGIYDAVRRPLWVTEWNNGANWTTCADPTAAQQAAAVQAMMDMLESTPFVERYAIYNWVEDMRRVKWDDGSLTAAGVNYRDTISSLAYRQELPDSGVGSSARYPFDGDTHDAWGNGFDLMRIGAPRFTAGRYGQAIALNGARDYLQVSPRVGDTADWSFTGWVYWYGGGDWQRIFDLGLDTSHYLFLTPKAGGDGGLRFAINNGGGEQQLNAPALSAGVWTHLAVTISGNTGKLFVNGTAVATNASMTVHPADVGTKFNYLGKSQFSADPLFGGRFDDFRFVSSALNDAQVAAIYNTPPPQFRTTPIHKPDAFVGQAYSATLAGEAIGNGPLAFTKMDGPGWLSLAANGALSGTPGATNGGVNRFLVRVTDTNGSLNVAELLITVPTFTVSVASSADDAEQAASGAVYLTSTDLEMVNDTATGAGDQMVGVRFADVSIPRGAMITSATIQFTADESQSEPASLNIFAEATDDAAVFQDVANNIGARARTSVSVPWQPAAWAAGGTNATQRTPNVAGLVQEVTSRAGWASGNALAFIVTGTGHRTAESFDKAGGNPARLAVNFISPSATYTVSATVNSGMNDAEQAASGTVNLTSTDLEMVSDAAGGAGDQIVGLRFENLAVPPGAVIASARIQLCADEAQSEATALTIRAQAADHAPGFTTEANNISARTMTTNAVAWAPNPWMVVDERGPWQRTPDVSALVSEIAARPGWASGNAMVFVVNGTGHRTANSADLIGGSPATLTVIYTTEIPLGTYARWAATRTNVSSLTGDPDGDGYNNLFEYALGLDPASGDRGAMRLVLNGSSLELTYTRPASVTDLTYLVEWADNIDSTTWSSAGVTQQIISDDGTGRTIRALIPKGIGGQRFVRLKLTYGYSLL